MLGDARINRNRKHGPWGRSEEIEATEFESIWTAARGSPLWLQQVATAQMARRGAVPIWLNDWNDTPEQRPTKADFDPYGGCLDAIDAWQNFGGLSRTAAYERFCESPGRYQEDFMFMGGVAFAYYYPVLERYVLKSSVENNDEADVEAMLILPYCIELQFDAKTAPSVQHLRLRLLELAAHVRNNLGQYSRDLDEQKRIDEAWQRLESGLLVSVVK
jgi:hypothetical protein